MALGQDPQVVDELVAMLHGVFEEEAVPDGVVGDVVLDAHVIGAMRRRSRNGCRCRESRGVLDVLAFPIAHQMPVDRIPGEVHVLAHAIELDAGDIHLTRDHSLHHVSAEEQSRTASGDAWMRMLRVSMPTSPPLIHAEGDPAVVHVVQLLVEHVIVLPWMPEMVRRSA